MIEELAEEHHLFGKRGCDTIFVTFPFSQNNETGKFSVGKLKFI